MNREARIQLITAILYVVILLAQGKDGGFHVVARWYLHGAKNMRRLGNWAYTTAIRWENSARELVTS